MSIIKKMRKQKAIWWQRLTPDKFGRFTFASPIEIACRWDDIAHEYVSHQGEKQVSRSIVFVDRIMSPGDRLKRGEMESNTPDDPLEATDTFEIKQFGQLPNLRATETLLTATL